MRWTRIFKISIGFLFLSGAILQAQTAAELETVLGTSVVTCGQAARFVLASSGDEVHDAFDQALNRGWLPKGTSPDDPVTMGKLSFLMMKAFGMKGGMMYTILPGPRYAFRSMVSRSLIQGSSDPGMKLAGDRFLTILGKVLNAVGGE